jgi:hypothetical protein
MNRKLKLFADPNGWSYPSGHVANTVIWYLLLVVLAGALLRGFGRGPPPGRVRGERTLVPTPADNRWAASRRALR